MYPRRYVKRSMKKQPVRKYVKRTYPRVKRAVKRVMALPAKGRRVYNRALPYRSAVQSGLNLARFLLK